ncbi:hypothetical protein OG204_18765 [Streptomyces sp. NBC_01387]|uniref:hypothetical protein n=1 Tax=unclassified Streptomyces TaxID=2593676 RepID=UPI00224FD00E|nr:MULTISPECIES: hypothetical protein [unclassified Streptomyces]MCX4549603.1 hypothetical protein [Streptomyces sp. NBC_01500]WSC21136.1 hypothetical protein OIE60_16400 [Streptomyces sp. NBC_01766]
MSKFKRSVGTAGASDGMSVRKDKSSKVATPNANGNRAERRAATKAAKKKG